MEALAFYEQHYHNAQTPGAHRGMGYPPMGYQPGYPPPAANPQAAWLGLGWVRPNPNPNHTSSITTAPRRPARTAAWATRLWATNRATRPPQPTRRPPG